MIASIAWPLGVLVGYSVAAALTPGPGEEAAAMLWAPSAVFLASLMVNPRRAWPLLAGCAYLGMAVVGVRLGFSPSVAVAFPFLPISAVTGSAWALQRLSIDPALGDLRSTTLFIVVGPAAVSVLVAVWWTGFVSASPGAEAAEAAWHSRPLGTALGLLIVTPAIMWLAARARGLRDAVAGRRPEAAALAAAVAATPLVLRFQFWDSPLEVGHVPTILCVPLPLLLWAAIRFGTGVAALCLNAVLASMIWLALVSTPSGSHQPALDLMTAIQATLAVIAVPMLLFASAMQERRVASRAVHEREHLLSTTLDSVAATVIVADRDGVVRYASHGWTAYVRGVTGVADASGLGVRYLDMCRKSQDTATIERGRGAVASVLSGAAVHASALYQCFVRPDMPDPAWLLMQVDALPPERGGAVISLLDVTDRRQAEIALESSEARLRRVMDVARIGEWESDLRSGRVWWSETMCRIAGLEPGAPLDQSTFTRLLHPDDRALDTALRDVYLTKGGYQEAQLRMVRPDGTTVWIESRGEVVPGSDGVVVGASLDITARRQAEERLRHALADVQRLRDQLEAENVYLHEELSASGDAGEIVVRSAEMRAVLALVSGVARTLTPVLVTGETGTGKEVLARAIHQMSPRKARPLVRVNCTALPATLIESELFGHERGAFTGASERRIGRFELADGGTLFLDEIGELPLELQSKLLRAVQEGEFERVGGSKTLRVSARVIAATNRDLSALISAGTFRADLYYRLNVFPVTIPPLRDRISDIEPLAQAALSRCAHRVGRVFDALPEAVVEALRNYRWPGNVRELQNVIERAVLLSRGSTLALPDGWDRTDPTAPARPAAEARPSAVASSGEPAQLLSLRDLERRHILRVLEHTRWRIDGPHGAAAILAMNASTLRSRMLKLQILTPSRAAPPATPGATAQ